MEMHESERRGLSPPARRDKPGGSLSISVYEGSPAAGIRRGAASYCTLLRTDFFQVRWFTLPGMVSFFHRRQAA